MLKVGDKVILEVLDYGYSFKTYEILKIIRETPHFLFTESNHKIPKKQFFFKNSSINFHGETPRQSLHFYSDELIKSYERTIKTEKINALKYKINYKNLNKEELELLKEIIKERTKELENIKI